MLLLALMLSAAPAKSTVLKAARLYDGKSAALVSPGLVVVTGDSIAAVGPKAAIPDDADVVDLGDATLIPGLIDALRPGVLAEPLSPGTADGPEALRARVRLMIKHGADVIKVCATGGVLSLGDDVESAQLTQAELDAIVDEAHARKKKVAVHAHG